MSSNNNEPSSAEKRAERITRYKEERRKQLQQRQYANLSTTAASAAAGECSSSSNEEHIEEESYAKYKYVPNFFYSGGIKLPEFLIFFLRFEGYASSSRRRICRRILARRADPVSGNHLRWRKMRVPPPIPIATPRTPRVKIMRLPRP